MRRTLLILVNLLSAAAAIVVCVLVPLSAEKESHDFLYGALGAAAISLVMTLTNVYMMRRTDQRVALDRARLEYEEARRAYQTLRREKRRQEPAAVPLAELQTH